MINLFLIIFILFKQAQATVTTITDDSISNMVNNLLSISGTNIQTQFQAYVNRSCIQNIDSTNIINEFSAIPPNELCISLVYDFTSAIENYPCYNYICNSNIGQCKFDYITKYAYCSGCQGSYSGSYCAYNSNDYSNMIDNIGTIFGFISKKVQKSSTGLIITNTSDYTSYLNLLEVVVPFYYTAYSDDMNSLFYKIDYLQNMLYKNVDFSKVNISDATISQANYNFLNYMISYSIFSYNFDYTKFISIFEVDDTPYAYNILFGRSSAYLNLKNNVSLSVGSQGGFNYTTLSQSYYFGTGGLPKLSMKPTVIVPANISYAMFENYYHVQTNGTFSFKIKYVLTYVFNPRVFYNRAGQLVKTPIVGLYARSDLNIFTEFSVPSKNSLIFYEFIKITVPWSYEKLTLQVGDYVNNCRVLKWNFNARQWFPSYNSFIDSSTNQLSVTFYVKEFGTFAVDCDYVIKRATAILS